MNFKNENTDRLFDAVLSLENREECEAFFEDLCTIKEIQDMAQRFQVAGLLNAGKSYNEISTLTGASTTTITRVGKCLNYGNGGYRKILDRTEK